ncbi:MAG: amidohydrolase [Candidatus Cloacimonetes bacterium]|nr:amidohydrolase [Candidatus Cloacimonadota bacterium]
MDAIALRHALHQIPELAFKEHKTKALLLKYLHNVPGIADKRWTFHEFKHSNGILVAYNAGYGAYKLFRADMDALPIQETVISNYSSQHKGFMHACGHDVHMSILMGLIYRIAEGTPATNLLFLFQPAEEGKGGAQSVLGEGIIQSYDISSAIALHVASDLAAGTISSKAGIFFGIPQEFDVRFYGKSAHVAYPEKGINALQAGLDFMNQITNAIHELNKTERVIYHVGKMNAGDIRNIIPAKCILEGTHRSLKKEVCNSMNQMTYDYADSCAKALGATAKVELHCSYDPVVNDAALVQQLMTACAALNMEYQEAETAMTGEDFGFFTSLYPGMLFWLGSGCNQPLHSDKFLPADECIESGIALMHHLALH